MIMVVTLMFSIILSVSDSSAGTSLAPAINHLLTYLEASNCRFIRNGEEYDSKSAVGHIRKKYDHFRNEIHTPEDFIELCATKSLMSGRPYLVKCKDSDEILCAEWLRKELKNYRKASQSSAL
jgi:hypothetical protein